jgi:hypothetical protein
MRRFKHVIALVAGAVMLGLVAEAGALEFSPTIEFTLGSTKASENTTLRTLVKQDQGEEELASVELLVPAGFSLAVDQQLTEGERLGTGTIQIHVGPRCRGAGPLSGPATVPVSIVERNRRSSEIADGAVAVYVVDLRPVTTIDLLVYGSADKGWQLRGNIPPNADTCPPFTFDASFQQRAQTSQSPIIVNPSSGGTYTLEAIFKGLENSEAHLKQSVIIEGPGGGGAAATGKLTKAERKKCKKKSTAKARKRCLKKQRAD